MFKELREEYETENDKVKYFKQVHEKIMSFKDINYLIKDSDINELIFNGKEIQVLLNDSFSNIKMSIDENDFEEIAISLLCFGHYEVEETNMVLKILSMINTEKKTVLDIGANLGWYSLNILKKFPESKVYSFEPSEDTFKRLKNNFYLNNMSTENLQNTGLYNENGFIDFYYDKAGSGASSIKNIRERSTVEKISVPIIKLDDWCKKNSIEKVDFIKCDVEGSELFVYQGGKETISKCKPIIFSEMLRKWSAKFGYHPNDIIRFMNELEYSCYVISKGVLKEIKEVTEETVETNYFFLNNQKHADLIDALKIKE